MTYEEQKDPELFRKSPWSFPRGMVNGDSAEETAKNEILEEIGGKGSLTYLGVMTPDSGILSDWASIFLMDLTEYSPKKGYEAIEDAIEVTMDELQEMVRRGEITDGFTLSAVMLYQLRR